MVPDLYQSSAETQTVNSSTPRQLTWDINAGPPVVLDAGNQYVCGVGLSSMRQGVNWYYYLADGLGSTMAIVGASGDVGERPHQRRLRRADGHRRPGERV